MAEREGKYVADRLNKLAVNKDSGPFKFKSMGMLAYLGGHEGLSDLPDIKIKGAYQFNAAYLHYHFHSRLHTIRTERFEHFASKYPVWFEI